MGIHKKIIYLCITRTDGIGVWFELGKKPRYFSEIIVSTGPVEGHKTWFTAHSERFTCVVHWCDSQLPSPLPYGNDRVYMFHGEKFHFNGIEHVIWCQDSNAPWGRISNLSDVDLKIQVELDKLDKKQLKLAAHRFLGLPNSKRQWTETFTNETGFIQYRNGIVPEVRNCRIAKIKGGYEFHWDVNIWSKWTKEWQTGRETMSFKKPVKGDDLRLLLDCATILSFIPDTYTGKEMN